MSQKFIFKMLSGKVVYSDRANGTSSLSDNALRRIRRQTFLAKQNKNILKRLQDKQKMSAKRGF